MSDEKDKTESGFGVSAKIEAKTEIPSESSGRAVEAFLDLISPFTEGLGAVGDKIQSYRIDSSIKTLRRAKELADKKGLEVKSPPLKFTVKLLENASMEDPEDGIVEMWAKLLKEGATNYNENLDTYISILSQLNSSEANFLEKIAAKTGGGLEKLVDNDIYLGVALSLNKSSFDKLDPKNFAEDINEAKSIALYAARKSASDISDCGGLSLHVVIPSKRSGIDYQEINKKEISGYGIAYTDQYLKNKTSIDKLKYLGLIDIKEYNHYFHNPKKVNSSVEGVKVSAEITRYGAEFLHKCKGIK